jgi:streptomycin 6-kinase
VLAGLLARLSAVAAPEGLRRLGDITARMLHRVPAAVELRPGTCTSATSSPPSASRGS